MPGCYPENIWDHGNPWETEEVVWHQRQRRTAPSLTWRSRLQNIVSQDPLKIIPHLKVCYHILWYVLQTYENQDRLITTKQKKQKETKYDRRMVLTLCLAEIIFDQVWFSPKLSERIAVAVRTFLTGSQYSYARVAANTQTYEPEPNREEIEANFNKESPDPTEKPDIKKYAKTIDKTAFIEMFWVLLEEKWHQWKSPSWFIIVEGIRTFIDKQISFKEAYKKLYPNIDSVEIDPQISSKYFAQAFFSSIKWWSAFSLTQYYYQYSSSKEVFKWFQKNFAEELFSGIKYWRIIEPTTRIEDRGPRLG